MRKNTFDNNEFFFNTESNSESSMLPEDFENNKKNGSRKNRRRNTFIKKAGALAMSAVLFGGLAAGTFQGVNTLIAANTQSSSQSASAQTSLLKASQTSSDSGTSATGSLDVSDIASAAMPSIVSITNRSVQEVQNYFNLYGYNYQQQQQETESCGSGIIIGQNDTELLIVTNYHVVENVDTLSVSFIDNQTCEASIKGTDSDNDLAVMAVSLENIPQDTLSNISAAVIGDSDSLKVGEQVVAIGNALGYGQSVTTGIVSATNRTLTTSSDDGTDGTTSTYIQTDAAINPGNSGGALLNMDGEVIGINTAKLSSTEIEGMGYAIPISRVQDIIENLMNETTKVKVDESNQGAIGVSCRDISSDIAQAYQIPQGVYIGSVSADSPAAAAGITAGSILTKFDGTSVSSVSELQNLLQYYAAGTQVEITVMVPDQGTYAEKTVTVTLENADSASAASANAGSVA